MPPKKKDTTEGAEGGALLTGFTDKECKLLAAAFVSSTGPDKYDYDLMATLTGNTAGSLKKMWPPVKKKTIETHVSFGTFLGQAGAVAASGGETKPTPAPKANGTRKRKAADEVPDDANDDLEPTSAGQKSDSASKSEIKKKTPAAKSKGRPKKQVKKEESTADDEAEDKSGENSADGGDGLGKEIEDEV